MPDLLMNIVAGGTRIYFNQGGGEFDGSDFYDFPYYIGRFFVVGDWNQDQRADLAFASEGTPRYSVLLNRCPLASACFADLNGDGELNFFDVAQFIALFQEQSPDADLNGDGEFDFFDVSAFLVEYQSGCG